MPDLNTRNPTLQVISMAKKEKMNIIMEMARQSNVIKSKNVKSQHNYVGQRFNRDKYNSLMKKSIYDLRLKRAQKQLKNKDTFQKLNLRQQSEEIDALIDIIKRTGSSEEKSPRKPMVHVPLPREFYELKPIIPSKSDSRACKETERTSNKLVTRNPEYNRYNYKEPAQDTITKAPSAHEFPHKITREPVQGYSMESLSYDTYSYPVLERKTEKQISRTKLKDRTRSDEWLTLSTHVVKPKDDKAVVTREIHSNVDKSTSDDSKLKAKVDETTSTSLRTSVPAYAPETLRKSSSTVSLPKLDASTSTNDLEEYINYKSSLTRTSITKSDKCTLTVDERRVDRGTDPEIVDEDLEILRLSPEGELYVPKIPDKLKESDVKKVKYSEPEMEETGKRPELSRSMPLREMSTICSDSDRGNIESYQSFDMVLGDNELSELNELTELQIIENSWTIVNPIFDPIGDSERVSLIKLSPKKRTSPRSDKLLDKVDGPYEKICVVNGKSNRTQPRELDSSDLKSERTRNIKYLDSTVEPELTRNHKFEEKRQIYDGSGYSLESMASDPQRTFEEKSDSFRMVSKEDELYNSNQEKPLKASNEVKTQNAKSEMVERKKRKSKSHKKSRKILPEVKLSEYKGFYVVHTTNDWSFS